MSKPTQRRSVRKSPAKRSNATTKSAATKTAHRPKQAPSSAKGVSKLDRIVAALRTPKGASIPDLMKLTGWQAHSVRGALSGALKKDRDLSIVSEKSDGERVYRIGG